MVSGGIFFSATVIVRVTAFVVGRSTDMFKVRKRYGGCTRLGRSENVGFVHDRLESVRQPNTS